jgi:hypothetical protein
MDNQVTLNIVGPRNRKAFETDSLDYEILRKAVMQISVPGIVCEIGTRRAGSTKVIIDSLVASNKTSNPLICIDPYGNIPYNHTDDNIGRCDYTNGMRNETIPDLCEYAYSRLKNFVFFNLGDDEFFKRFGDGVPLYEEEKRIENTYSLVFFDGPHGLKNVIEETEFFFPRTVKGSIFVYDDIVGHYDHDFVEKEYLIPNSWQLIETGNRKSSYIKL